MRRPVQLGQKPRPLHENEVLEGTLGAPESGEAAGEGSTRDELPELALDEAGETVAVGSRRDSSKALALFQVVPNAVRLGAATDPPLVQSELARGVLRDHLVCFASIATLLVLRITAPRRPGTGARRR